MKIKTKNGFEVLFKELDGRNWCVTGTVCALGMKLHSPVKYPRSQAYLTTQLVFQDERLPS